MGNANLIDKDNLQSIYNKVRALRNKKRNQILDLLIENNGMTVTELIPAIGEVQSRTSQHIGILRNAGFIFYAKRGKEKVYFVDKKAINRFNNIETEMKLYELIRRIVETQDEVIKQMDININLLLKELEKWEQK